MTSKATNVYDETMNLEGWKNEMEYDHQKNDGSKKGITLCNNIEHNHESSSSCRPHEL